MLKQYTILPLCPNDSIGLCMLWGVPPLQLCLSHGHGSVSIGPYNFCNHLLCCCTMLPLLKIAIGMVLFCEVRFMTVSEATQGTIKCIDSSLTIIILLWMDLYQHHINGTTTCCWKWRKWVYHVDLNGLFMIFLCSCKEIGWENFFFFPFLFAMKIFLF